MRRTIFLLLTFLSQYTFGQSIRYIPNPFIRAGVVPITSVFSDTLSGNLVGQAIGDTNIYTLNLTTLARTKIRKNATWLRPYCYTSYNTSQPQNQRSMLNLYSDKALAYDYFPLPCYQLSPGYFIGFYLSKFKVGTSDFQYIDTTNTDSLPRTGVYSRMSFVGSDSILAFTTLINQGSQKDNQLILLNTNSRKIRKVELERKGWFNYGNYYDGKNFWVFGSNPFTSILRCYSYPDFQLKRNIMINNNTLEQRNIKNIFITSKRDTVLLFDTLGNTQPEPVLDEYFTFRVGIYHNNRLTMLNDSVPEWPEWIHGNITVEKNGAIWALNRKRGKVYRFFRGKVLALGPEILKTGSVPFEGHSPFTIDSTNRKYFVNRSDTAIVEINDIIPKIHASDTLFRACLSKPILFADSSTTIGQGIFRWKWHFGDGDSTTLQNPSHFYKNPGTYTVRLRVIDSNTSRNEITRIIVVLPGSTVTINGPDSIKSCKPVLIKATSQLWNQPIWTTPLGIISGVEEILATQSGWYQIQNEIDGCVSKDSIYVLIGDTSQASFLLRANGQPFTDTLLNIKDNQFPFIVDAITQTQAVRYRWFLNGTLQTGNSFSQGFTFVNEGDFRIKLITTSSDSCLGKAEKTLNLKRLILPPLEIPNLVTQNGDNKNDLFEILQLPFYPANQLTIFNRWGKGVFNTSPYQNDWPPADLEPGIYFYKLTAANQVFSGWVDVVK